MKWTPFENCAYAAEINRLIKILRQVDVLTSTTYEVHIKFGRKQSLEKIFKRIISVHFSKIIILTVAAEAYFRLRDTLIVVMDIYIS
jgi:hypothetical protein